jgi:hypothetical protein
MQRALRIVALSEKKKKIILYFIIFSFESNCTDLLLNQRKLFLFDRIMGEATGVSKMFADLAQQGINFVTLTEQQLLICGQQCTISLQPRISDFEFKWHARITADGILQTGKATKYSRAGAMKWAVKDFTKKLEQRAWAINPNVRRIFNCSYSLLSVANNVKHLISKQRECFFYVSCNYHYEV